MAWTLEYTVFAWLTALILLARLTLWLALKSTGLFRHFVLLFMRAPAVLLADVWFRGCADKTSLYGSIADILERAGCWSNQWPGNHIVYLKYFAIAIALCLVFVDDSILLVFYKFFFNRMAMIQMIYILSQQSVFRVGPENGLGAARYFFDVYLLYESFLSPGEMTGGLNDFCEVMREFANGLKKGLDQSELPEWFTERLSSVISTTLTSFTSTNSTVIANALIIAPFFITSALESAGLPVWWVRWINGAMFRALALVLCFVVFVYIIAAISMTVLGQVNRSPAVTVVVSWLTLLVINVAYHNTVSTSSDGQFTFTDVAFEGLNDSLKSVVAYIGFSFTIGLVFLGIFRVIIWYAGIADAVIDLSAVRLGQVAVMLLYGVDMYLFAQVSTKNSLIGALAVILLGVSQAVVLHIQPLIESGVRSRSSSINALLIFCVAVFVLPLVMIYLVLSSFGLTDWCSQTVVMTVFTCLNAVKFIASYIIRNFWNRNVEKKEQYLRAAEKISLYSIWTIACPVIFYYIVVFLSVDWSFTAIHKAIIVTFAFVYTPYADWKIARRRRTMSSRLVASFPAPDVGDRDVTDRDCPICLVSLHPENGMSCKSPCGHLFHSRCLVEWVRIKVTCPMCNRIIGTFENQRQVHVDQEAMLREFQQQMEMLQQLFVAGANGPQVPHQALPAMWQQLLAGVAR